MESETLINRLTIFDLIYYSKITSDPLIKLVLIQIFEATGVVFIGHTRKAAIDMEMDNELQYFGKMHYEEEFGHSVQSKDLRDQILSKDSFTLRVNHCK